MATIFIENLCIETIIGVCDWEQEKKQPLFFDIEMETDINDVARTDNIEQALNYAEVAFFVSQYVKDDNNKLLESMVAGLAKELLNKFALIDSLSISVRKPLAIDEADYAGMHYSLSR